MIESHRLIVSVLKNRIHQIALKLHSAYSLFLFEISYSFARVNLYLANDRFRGFALKWSWIEYGRFSEQNENDLCESSYIKVLFFFLNSKNKTKIYRSSYVLFIWRPIFNKRSINLQWIFSRRKKKLIEWEVILRWISIYSVYIIPYSI